MEIDVGELNKRIDILYFEEGEDDLGQDIRDERELKKVWAKVRSIKSEELIKNQKNVAQSEKEFTIRYRKEIDKTMKIRYREQIYDISSIENVDEADKFMILHATAIEEDANVDQSIKDLYRKL